MLFELMVKIGRDLLEDARRILVRQKTLDYSHIEENFFDEFRLIYCELLQKMRFAFRDLSANNLQ